jgi:hypothetical protein
VERLFGCYGLIIVARDMDMSPAKGAGRALCTIRPPFSRVGDSPCG